MFKKVQAAIVLLIVLACVFIAEAITSEPSNAKELKVITLVQHEPTYFENTDIVGSENSFNIQKFTNPNTVHEPKVEQKENVETDPVQNQEPEPTPIPVQEVQTEQEPSVAVSSSDNAIQHTSENVQVENFHMHVCSTATDRLTKSKGVYQGPSGKESWYNLNMSGVVKIMRNAGFSEEEFPYWICEGCKCKMLGPYIMVAADLSIRPRGTILETSLGTSIVCDTGSFIKHDQNQVDIAVQW